MNDSPAPTTQHTTRTNGPDAGPNAGAAVALESPPPPTVWPCVNYRDARAAIRYVVDVLGFVEVAVYTDDADDSVVVHSELRWPEGGGVMIGTAARAESDARRALSTRCGGRTFDAVERSGEDARGRRLAATARTREQVGVIDAPGIEGRAQRDGDVLLPHHLGEGRGSIFPVQGHAPRVPARADTRAGRAGRG